MASKIVLLTGATRGLGRAMVSEFVRAGWTVAGCGSDASRVAELARAFQAPHLFRRCDVAVESDVSTFCAAVEAELGVPDLVLNNAARITPNAPLWETSASDFSRIVDVNLKGPAYVMQRVLPSMLRRGSGVVVNFSSGWGRSTSPEVAPYCATKWAIEGLSQAVAQETAGRVAVVALNPGIIDTEMLRSTFGDGAGSYPPPEAWAKRAVPFLLRLGSKDNGRPLTAPSP